MNNFSFFNKQLYDESNEEFYIEYNSISNTFEEEESNNTGSTNETYNSEDEEKLIPKNLFDSSINVQSMNKVQYIKEIDDTQNNIIYPNEDSKSQKEENKECIINNENNEKEEEISNIKSTEKNSKESSTSLPSNLINQLDINSEPFIPKYKYSQSKIFNNQNHNNHLIYFYNDDNDNILFNIREKNYYNKDKNKKNKKKKKTFVQKINDWFCYRCKNINFCFREKCNKCHLSKEESEIKYNEAGKKLLKLVNTSDNN